MGTMSKTDNGNLEMKLALRRRFLREYHSGQEPYVFEACQGDGVIWSKLRPDFPARVWGVDLKPKAGRLKIDSARVLAQPGWSFDVIDVDTYGSPWGHWLSILEHCKKPTTVFLTIGALMHQGSMNNEAVRAMGLWSILSKGPQALRRALSPLCTDYMIGLPLERGFAVPLCVRGDFKNATYIGIRLEPTHRSDGVTAPDDS